MIKNLLTVAENWASFAKAVFRGTQVPRAQHEGMRRSFYAGYYAALEDLQDAAGAGSSPDEAAAYVALREAECTDFDKNLLKNFRARKTFDMGKKST